MGGKLLGAADPAQARAELRRVDPERLLVPIDLHRFGRAALALQGKERERGEAFGKGARLTCDLQMRKALEEAGGPR